MSLRSSRQSDPPSGSGQHRRNTSTTEMVAPSRTPTTAGRISRARLGRVSASAAAVWAQLGASVAAVRALATRTAAGLARAAKRWWADTREEIQTSLSPPTSSPPRCTATYTMPNGFQWVCERTAAHSGYGNGVWIHRDPVYGEWWV